MPVGVDNERHGRLGAAVECRTKGLEGPGVQGEVGVEEDRPARPRSVSPAEVEPTGIPEIRAGLDNTHAIIRQQKRSEWLVRGVVDDRGMPRRAHCGGVNR